MSRPLARCRAWLQSALLLGLLAALPVQAQPAASTAGRPLWELGLGVGALSLPHYRGADQRHSLLLPLPYFIYRGSIFKADRDGARAVLFDSERLELNLSASASAPSRSRDNRAREGMADLSPTLELGPNLNWTLAQSPGWKLDLRLPLRAAVTLQRSPQWLGWIATPNLNLDLHPAPGWNLGLLAGPVFGSRGLHAYFYDVPLSQARAGRPAYRAPGGYAGFSATAALSRHDGRRWLGAFIKFDALGGAAFADSPLLRQRNQWSAGLALAWVLTQSDTLVSVAP